MALTAWHSYCPWSCRATRPTRSVPVASTLCRRSPGKGPPAGSSSSLVPSSHRGQDDFCFGVLFVSLRGSGGCCWIVIKFPEAGAFPVRWTNSWGPVLILLLVVIKDKTPSQDTSLCIRHEQPARKEISEGVEPRGGMTSWPVHYHSLPVFLTGDSCHLWGFAELIKLYLPYVTCALTHGDFQNIFSMKFVLFAPGHPQVKTCFYITSYINIITKVFCVVSRFWRHNHHWRSLCDSHTFHFLPSINCPEIPPLHTELSSLISWEELEPFFFPPKYFLCATCRFFWPLMDSKSLFNYPNPLFHQINGNICLSKFAGLIFWSGNSCFNIFSISGEKLKAKPF